MQKAIYVLYVCVVCIITYRAPAIERQRRGGVNSQTVRIIDGYNTDGDTWGVGERDGEPKPGADSIIRSLCRSGPTARVCIVRIVLDKLRRRRVCVPFRPAIRIVRRLWVCRISHHSCRGRGRCHLRWWTRVELMCRMGRDKSRRGCT